MARKGREGRAGMRLFYAPIFRGHGLRVCPLLGGGDRVGKSLLSAWGGGCDQAGAGGSSPLPAGKTT